jgi:ubiquinone/menaquinone biosynthesis C-methylase UbiE
MHESQSQIFQNSEGNAWYIRNPKSNQIAGNEQVLDFIYSTLDPFRDQVSTILEIGCGGGAKLEALSKHFQASGFGIDPSAVAIKDATKRCSTGGSSLNFQTGLATNLPYDDGQFDLVFFGFCLYLVPPQEIFRAVTEADRVLRNGGFLAILDFDYGSLKVNPYKHASGVFSFKNNYSELFTSSNYYHLVSKWSFNHFSKSFSSDKDERIAIEVLFKECM